MTPASATILIPVSSTPSTRAVALTPVIPVWVADRPAGTGLGVRASTAAVVRRCASLPQASAHMCSTDQTLVSHRAGQTRYLNDCERWRYGYGDLQRFNEEIE